VWVSGIFLIVMHGGLIMVLFASPDFGAGGMACMIVFLAMASLAIVAIGGIYWIFRAVRNPKWRAVIAVFLVSTGIFAGYFYWLYSVKPYEEFDQLLSGSEDIEIVRVEIAGQRKEAVISDPKATSYLSQRVRAGGRRGDEHGFSYTATFFLSSGSSVHGSIDIPENKGFFNMYYPIDTLGEGRFYTIWLSDPIPASLAGTFERLRK
jgi:hypothetical protein